MSLAFEITSDDIVNVVNEHFNVYLHEEDAENVIDDFIDLDAVEKAALYGLSVEDQTEMAYDEIHFQLCHSQAFSDLLKDY